MTRINLIEPKFLTDQHLFAEYREITRIFPLVKNAQAKQSYSKIITKIPANYKLNSGHVLFFYNKLEFIEKRYFALRDEVLNRGFNITLKDSITDFRNEIPEIFYQDFIPNKTDLAISIIRLIEKITAKPNWYRFKGEIINDENYCKTLQEIL